MPTDPVRRHPAIGIALSLFVFFVADASAATRADKVLVMKHERRLVILRNGVILKSYKVSIGRNPGRKIRRGDNRTPEGIYRIDRRNPGSRFYKALHISYPNASDIDTALKSGAPPGEEISIHGLPRGFEDLGTSHAVRNWTKGCIAVSNAEMDELWQLVPDGTPVEIIP